MDRFAAIQALLQHGIDSGMMDARDEIYVRNYLLDALQLSAWESPEALDSDEAGKPFQFYADFLLDDAADRGVIPDSVTHRDLLETRMMDCMMPRPSEANDRFAALREQSPVKATDWFYQLSCDGAYVRTDRLVRDLKWKTESVYGDIDITINLSKPEKDPAAIAAAAKAAPVSYPPCALCADNEGYAGRLDFPARQNLRIMNLEMDGEDWGLQYSPYGYYNEHCIVLSKTHRSMKISKSTFARLLSFVGQFPHYFLGSNADLPIVGGSILSHDHYQGGRYTFAMAKAPVVRPLTFAGFPDIEAGIVRWPLSVIRLTGADPQRITALSDKILTAWRGYSDPDAFIYAETADVPHNTITPIARMVDGKYQMDLVLRCNITTPDRPLGVYHPRPSLFHIKKENIGLIEVMGLAVLPARLKGELAALREHILAGEDLRADPQTAPHADWAEKCILTRDFTPETLESVIREEVGKVFVQVLEDAGVFKQDAWGQQNFMKFVQAVGLAE